MAKAWVDILSNKTPLLIELSTLNPSIHSALRRDQRAAAEERVAGPGPEEAHQGQRQRAVRVREGPGPQERGVQRE